ncbi:MAG: histidine kinase [Frankiales bacterium]|nr:histidine kinase [Frankiales bacterium]
MTELEVLLVRYHRAFNERDFDVWREVFDEDVEFLVDGMPFRGVDAVVGYGVGRVSKVPGLYIAAERTVSASGDTVVTEIDLVDGDPAGGPSRPTGTTCEICRLREGRIVSVRSYFMPEPADIADAVRVPARGEAGIVAEEQAALRRVATLVARGVSQDEVFAAVTEETAWLVAADTTSLMRFDPDDNVTLVATWTDRDSDVPIGATRPMDAPFRVMRESGRPRRWGPAELPRPGPFVEEAHALEMRSFIGVPVVVEGRTWGVMFASSAADQPFADDAEARLAGFTELVATAIANAHARAELRVHAEEQAALRRLATLVAAGTPAEEVLAAVVEEVGRLLEVDYTVLIRSDPGGVITVVGTWTSTGGPAPSPVGSRFAVGGRNVSTLVLRTGRPARLDAYADVTGTIGDTGARAWGFRSSVGVPISVEGRPWGLVLVAFTRDQPLPADTEARLAGFAELAATAVANAQARVELRRFAQEQAALRRVALLVARSAPAEQVFSAVAEEIGRVISVDLTGISRYDPDGTAAAVGGWTRTSDGASFPVGTRVRLGGRNVVTLVFETGLPARIDNSAEGTGEPAAFAHERKFGSVAGVPISVEGRLWGVVMVISMSTGPLPADTEVRLARFTELVATAIANAQAQAALTASRARIVAAADTTRRRIERDLHDGAQQRLVSLAMQLRAAQAAVPGAAAELDRVADGVSGVLDELREIAHGLHPAILAAGGLRPALKALARRSAVPVRLDLQAEARFPEPIEIAAYYVVCEALANTAKHAAATAIDVQLATDAGRLCVRVSDDGRGGADLTRGSGLVGLTDRVEALGGRLVLHSPPGAGTTVRVSLPLTAPARPGPPVAVTGAPDGTGRDLTVEPEPAGPSRGS